LQRRNTNDVIVKTNEEEKEELGSDTESPFKHFRKRLKPMQASMTLKESDEIKENSRNSSYNMEPLTSTETRPLKQTNSKGSLIENESLPNK